MTVDHTEKSFENAIEDNLLPQADTAKVVLRLLTQNSVSDALAPSIPEADAAEGMVSPSDSPRASGRGQDRGYGCP